MGRGSERSTCLLLYGLSLSEIARKRLEIIRSSCDGFTISEADLNLRGGGDILGTQQSGFSSFKFNDFTSNSLLFEHFLEIAKKKLVRLLEKILF